MHTSTKSMGSEKKYFLNCLKKVYLFGSAGSSWLHGLFSSCSGQASHCGGFSCCGARAQGTWASAAVAHGSVVVAPGL